MTVAVCLLIGAVVAASVSEFPLIPQRGMRWWQLEPRTPSVEPRQAARCLSGIRRGWRTSKVTLVRKGSSTSVSSLWLGVRGPKDLKSAAKALAAAAGCDLAEEKHPEPFPRTKKWWWSNPVPVDDLAPEEMHRRSATRASATLHPDAYDEERIGEFAAHADIYLDDDDALVMTAVPKSDNRHTHVVVATTSRQLAQSWTDVCSPKVHWPMPCVSVWFSAAFGFLSLVIALSAMGTFGIIKVNVPTVAIIMFWVTAVIGLGSAGWHSWHPRAAEKVRLHWNLPLRWWTRHKSGFVPSSHFAGWANMGERAAVTASQKAAPEPVTNPQTEAALVGVDSEGRQCWLPEKDRHSGVFAVGDPGTGKTTFLLGLLRADALRNSKGADKSGLWIETKGEGAERAVGVIRAAGVEPVRLRSDTDTGLRLELIDWANPSRGAHLLTEAIRYAFEFDDIRESSAEILNAVFLAAISAPPEAARQLGYTGKPNVLRLAYHLLGGDAVAGKEKHARKVIEDLGGEAATQFLSYLPPHKSARDSQHLMEPPRNKMQALLPAEGLFTDKGRPSVELGTLITDHKFTVLDLSPATSYGEYTDKTAKRIAAMSMFIAWDTIKRHCDNWQKHGRSVSLYSDELADIAGLGDSRSEIVQQIADQGRSRGVWPTFASQRPGQIPPRTREAVMSFGSRVFFRVEHYETAEAAATDLDDVYEISELRSFGVGSCAARLRSGGVAQPAFTLYPQDL